MRSLCFGRKFCVEPRSAVKCCNLNELHRNAQVVDLHRRYFFSFQYEESKAFGLSLQVGIDNHRSPLLVKVYHLLL